jgi:hypothetical protein
MRRNPFWREESSSSCVGGGNNELEELSTINPVQVDAAVDQIMVEHSDDDTHHMDVDFPVEEAACDDDEDDLEADEDDGVPVAYADGVQSVKGEADEDVANADEGLADTEENVADADQDTADDVAEAKKGEGLSDADESVADADQDVADADGGQIVEDVANADEDVADDYCVLAGEDEAYADDAMANVVEESRDHDEDVDEAQTDVDASDEGIADDEQPYEYKLEVVETLTGDMDEAEEFATIEDLLASSDDESDMDKEDAQIVPQALTLEFQPQSNGGDQCENELIDDQKMEVQTVTNKDMRDYQTDEVTDTTGVQAKAEKDQIENQRCGQEKAIAAHNHRRTKTTEPMQISCCVVRTPVPRAAGSEDKQVSRAAAHFGRTVVPNPAARSAADHRLVSRVAAPNNVSMTMPGRSKARCHICRQAARAAGSGGTARKLSKVIYQCMCITGTYISIPVLLKSSSS